MIEFLTQIDHSVFRLINYDLAHPLLDKTMPIATDLHKQGLFALVPVLLLLTYWIYKQRLSGVIRIFVLLGLLVVTDAGTHRVIKPLFQRERPHDVLKDTVLRTHRHSSYSFPSTHAVNTMGAATLLAFSFPSLKILLFFVALLVAYSRVYVGVHFPLDVLAGSALGYMIGIWFIKLDIFLQRKFRS